MDLVKIEENAVTVELSWADLSLLAYLCRTVRGNDLVPGRPDWSHINGYVAALGALFDAAGLASWAHTTSRDDATVESWRTVVPFSEPDREHREQRRAAMRADLAAREAAKAGTPAGVGGA